MSRLAIRGGRVIDGTGRPGTEQDVLVEGGHIIAVGPPASGWDNALEFDATGLVVAPGFIDLHSHADYSILAFPGAESALRQGVTTVAVGNCGGGVAPINVDHDIRPVAFAYRPEWGVDLAWRSFPDYLSRLTGAAINVAALVPHGALRNAAMGIKARPADRYEFDSMRGILTEALEAGAVGMSTGLQYRPGCWAPRSEIRDLVFIVGAHCGVYATHMRDRSEYFADAINEALETAENSGAHLQLSHVAPRPNAPPAVVANAYEVLSEAWASGAALGVDTFPEPWGPGLLVDLLPSDLLEGDTSTVLELLNNLGSRVEIEDYVNAETSFLARVDGYNEIFLSAVPGRPDLEGMSLPDAARESRATIGAFVSQLLIDVGDRLREVGIRHVYARESDLRKVLSFENCSVASDGIVTTGEGPDCPLLWSASTYGFTARLLEHYVRHERFLSLEEAVRRLTSLPATALGLSDRGVVATGHRADLVVFDPSEVADQTSPTDMARHPSGIELVVVNGVVAATASGATNTRSGMLAT